MKKKRILESQLGVLYLHKIFMNKHTFKAAVFKKKGLPQHYTFYFFISGKI